MRNEKDVAKGFRKGSSFGMQIKQMEFNSPSNKARREGTRMGGLPAREGTKMFGGVKVAR